MCCATLKATNSSFQKGMTFCRSIYLKKVMKQLAFIFEQPWYIDQLSTHAPTCTHFCALWIDPPISTFTLISSHYVGAKSLFLQIHSQKLKLAYT